MNHVNLHVSWGKLILKRKGGSNNFIDKIAELEHTHVAYVKNALWIII